MLLICSHLLSSFHRPLTYFQGMQTFRQLRHYVAPFRLTRVLPRGQFIQRPPATQAVFS